MRQLKCSFLFIVIFVFQDDFTCEDFANMNAQLLYKMFKAKTEYALHTAIRVKREDVVFLFLMDYDPTVMY